MNNGKLNDDVMEHVRNGALNHAVETLEGLHKMAVDTNAAEGSFTVSFHHPEDDVDVGDFVPEVILRVRKVTEHDLQEADLE